MKTTMTMTTKMMKTIPTRAPTTTARLHRNRRRNRDQTKREGESSRRCWRRETKKKEKAAYWIRHGTEAEEEERQEKLGSVSFEVDQSDGQWRTASGGKGGRRRRG